MHLYKFFPKFFQIALYATTPKVLKYAQLASGANKWVMVVSLCTTKSHLSQLLMQMHTGRNVVVHPYQKFSAGPPWQGMTL